MIAEFATRRGYDTTHPTSHSFSAGDWVPGILFALERARTPRLVIVTPWRVRSDVGEAERLATKFGVDRSGGDGKARILRGERSYVKRAAEAKGVAPAQVALAWVYAQQQRLGIPVVPIPGTKRAKWLEQNIAALDVTLTHEELALLDSLGSQVSGTRY